MTLPGWGRKVLLLAVIPVPPGGNANRYKKMQLLCNRSIFLMQQKVLCCYVVLHNMVYSVISLFILSVSHSCLICYVSSRQGIRTRDQVRSMLDPGRPFRPDHAWGNFRRVQHLLQL